MPGGLPGSAQAAGPRSTSTACGDNWSAAEQLGALPDGLLEISGLESSAKYPGVAWMQQDSDNPNRIFSFWLEGGRPRHKAFSVPGTDNHDWEDVAYSVGPDGVGRIWILENTNEIGEKKIFEVREPDPYHDTKAQLLGVYRLSYPGGAVNTEAMVALPGRLVFIPKVQGSSTVLELRMPFSKSGVNLPKPVGSLRDTGSWVTGAGTSSDNHLLATISAQDAVAVFEDDDAGLDDFTEDRPIFRKGVPDIQFEAIDFFPFASCDLVAISEDGTVWRLSNPGRLSTFETPDAPTGVTATPGDGSALVSWTAPTAAEPPTAYRVTAFDGAAEAASVVTDDASVTSAVVTGLVNDRAYTFTVTALNAAGESPTSGPSAAVVPRTAAPPTPVTPYEQPPSGPGYWMLSADGTVFGFGAGRPLGRPSPPPGTTATDLEPTPSAGGYWTVDTAGRVEAFGDASHFGSVAPGRLSAGEQATSLSRTPTGRGYWVFTSRGRAFAFGDAPVLGDMAGVPLNGPVLDSVASPSGRGYYMVGADGGIFAFGDAVFRGSMGGQRLNAGVRSLVPAPGGTGYWLVASDGGVFAFGAPFRGSMAGQRLNAPVTGMVRFGSGYLMVGQDGGIFNFSDQPFLGSLGGAPPARPIVAVAAVH